jgi:hypothetical protein
MAQQHVWGKDVRILNYAASAFCYSARHTILVYEGLRVKSAIEQHIDSSVAQFQHQRERQVEYRDRNRPFPWVAGALFGLLVALTASRFDLSPIWIIIFFAIFTSSVLITCNRSNRT